MLSPKTISSPGLMPLPTDSFASNMINPKTYYVFRFSFLGSYTSSERHIERMIEAI